MTSTNLSEIDAILAPCYANMDKATLEAVPRVAEENATKWTVADLFIRQWLNNMSDGFGMRNVQETFMYLVSKKDVLVEKRLISKDGYNNSGFSLWKDYNFHDNDIADPNFLQSLSQLQQAAME